MKGQITGTIEKIEATQQITDAFKKRTVHVSEGNDKYDNKWAIEFHQDNTDLPNSLKVGDQAVFDCEVVSREYKGKRYANVKCWKVEVMGAVQQSIVPEEDDDLPW